MVCLCGSFAAACSSIERRQYAQGWEALREIRGPFYAETYAEFMSIVRAAATAPKVSQAWCVLGRAEAAAITMSANHVDGPNILQGPHTPCCPYCASLVGSQL